jgi:photosystem II stability/assembly factor-like uncharacterized protein
MGAPGRRGTSAEKDLRRAALSAAAAAVALSSSVASANGRYPAAGQIAFDPAHPDTVLVRATYGLLLTTDAGQHWSWICERAVGYDGAEDPMMAFTADGTILAGLFEGLSSSHDSGCRWDLASGALAGHYIIDLSTERDDPSKAVLIISQSRGQDDAGANVYVAQLWETADDAQTWIQAGVDLPAGFVGLTVDTAPSDAQRVYVSGLSGAPDTVGVLERSDDGGATWQELPIPGSDGARLPYIAAVAPGDPDTVFVRVNGGSGDELVVTKDGGATWATVFQSQGSLLGFALSPDGATVAVGGEDDGLWTAPASTLAFTRASTIGVGCLAWAAAGLFVCGDELADAFTVGVSRDQGATFKPFLSVSQLCGPLSCAAGSDTAAVCPALWSMTRATLGGTTCTANADGGSPSASSASSTPSGGASSSGGGTSSYGGAGAGRGCGCGVAATTDWLPPALAIASIVLSSARRRRGATPHPPSQEQDDESPPR